MEGGEEGGLGMKKATGGKTQHGNPFLPPTIRALLSAEHSVQAGPERAGPRPEPLCPIAHPTGPAPPGRRENEQLWEKESKCQVLERFQERYFNRMTSFAFLKKSRLIFSFLHRPPSFPWPSGLTPRIRRALSTKHFSRPGQRCLAFCCQEPILI